jgi:hypothetical protein
MGPFFWVQSAKEWVSQDNLTLENFGLEGKMTKRNDTAANCLVLGSTALPASNHSFALSGPDCLL